MSCPPLSCCCGSRGANGSPKSVLVCPEDAVYMALPANCVLELAEINIAVTVALFSDPRNRVTPRFDSVAPYNFTSSTELDQRSEEHTSELQSHSFISYAV